LLLKLQKIHKVKEILSNPDNTLDANSLSLTVMFD